MSLRNILLYILMLSVIVPARGQGSAGSNIVSRTVLSGDGLKAAEQCVYDNGLGDVIQEVQSWPGSSLPSLAVRHDYDDYRRRTRSWLPVTSSGSDFQQPYRFTGKELDTMHGLNTYDYGARQYYSIVGRWDRMDPLCEKYYSISPYVYCENDPVRTVDPNGKQPVKYIDSDGNKHISWSIVVMVKALESGASQNRINRHEKYKQNLKDKYSKQFNHYLNGDGAGVINSSEERIISDFNITVVDVGDSYDLKEAKKLSKEYGQEIKEEGGKNGNAAVFMEGSTNGALGLTKQASLITIALNAPEGTESHELFHTSGIGDNGYTHGGILNSPPEPIKSEEVDKLWDVLPERK